MSSHAPVAASSATPAATGHNATSALRVHSRKERCGQHGGEHGDHYPDAAALRRRNLVRRARVRPGQRIAGEQRREQPIEQEAHRGREQQDQGVLRERDHQIPEASARSAQICAFHPGVGRMPRAGAGGCCFIPCRLPSTRQHSGDEFLLTWTRAALQSLRRCAGRRPRLRTGGFWRYRARGSSSVSDCCATDRTAVGRSAGVR